MADSALKLTHRYAAPPEEVFAAFIDPEVTKTGYAAGGMADVLVERDVRPGGKWRIVAKHGQTEMVAQGEYLEVVRPGLLVYTFAMPQFSQDTDRLTAAFAADGDGTLLTYTHDGPGIAAELAALKPGETGGTEHGWRAMLAGLQYAL